MYVLKYVEYHQVLQVRLPGTRGSYKYLVVHVRASVTTVLSYYRYKYWRSTPVVPSTATAACQLLLSTCLVGAFTVPGTLYLAGRYSE